MGEVLCDRELPAVPCVLVEDTRVKAVSSSFTELTGYTCVETQGRTIFELRDQFLRSTVDISGLGEVRERRKGYIFTRELQPREVTVEICKNQSSSEKVILFLEKLNPGLYREDPYLSQQYEDNLIGVAVYDVKDGILLKANHKYLDSLREPFNLPGNSIGRRIDMIFPGWMGSTAEHCWIQAVNTGKSVKVCGDRGYFVITPVSTEGKVRFLVINNFDAVDRKMYITQSEENEQRGKQLDAIFESLLHGIVITDKSGQILMMTEEARRQFAGSGHMQSLEDTPASVRFTNTLGNDLNIDQMPAHRAARGEKVKNEFVRIKGSGEEKTVCFSSIPVYGTNGEVEKVVTSIYDASELVRKERMIRQQKEQLDAVIQNMADGVFMIDRDLNLIPLNKATRTFFSDIDSIASVEEAIKSISFFSGIDGELITLKDLYLSTILSEGTFQDFRLTLVHREKKMYVSVNASPVYNNSGETTAALICIRNLTGQVKQDEMIKAQQKAILVSEHEKNDALKKAIEMKDEFLSLVSHELKTPITVINSAIQTMELVLRDELTPKIRSYIGKIEHNSNRQLRLVNNLLDITRANNGHIRLKKRNLDIVSLTRKITEEVQSYSSQKGVRLTFSSSLKYKFTGMDEEKFVRVLLNLLSNAIKYTPEGKYIKVRVYSKKEKVFVEVKDSGLGIPGEKLDLIFERFGQVDNSLSRQTEGMGIGLSLTKMYVEAMGGTISVKSEVNKGSTFTVSLPLETLNEYHVPKTQPEFSDKRLVQTIAIELSDIYI